MTATATSDMRLATKLASVYRKLLTILVASRKSPVLENVQKLINLLLAILENQPLYIIQQHCFQKCFKK